jgi:hypothetical protein
MPIRPDLRHFYGRHWRTVTRPRILERAGHKCEQCGKPDRAIVFTVTGKVVLAPHDIWPYMFWVAEKGGEVWRDQFGKPFPDFKIKLLPRKVRVVLTVAHLNHVAGDDRDKNLQALCQWHHLHLDASHHRESRQTRKDGARPLLAEGGNL